MKYNWRTVAAQGMLPLRFNHTLVTVKDGSANKVFAIGIEDDAADEGLQVYALDSRMEAWQKLAVSYADQNAVEAVKRGTVHTSAGVGNSLYVIGCNEVSVLQFNILERQWCIPDFAGALHLQETPQAAVAVGHKVVLLCGHKNVIVLDTVRRTWNSPKVLGKKPTYSNACTAALFDRERILVYGEGGEVWFLEVETEYIRRERKKSGEEVVGWSAGRRGVGVVVICGPSGVGKGTLINKLMNEFPQKFGFSVSHTTRLPREKEMNGVHYHFTARTAMELAVRNGQFLEHANVHGNMYGTSIAAVEAVSDAGKICILDIDVQGAESVKKCAMDAMFVFITPPSFEELEKRLRGRGTESEEQVAKRLSNAKRELKLGQDARLFDHVLVNDDLESTYMQLKKVIGVTDDYPVTGGDDAILIHNNGKLVVVESSGIREGGDKLTRGVNWRELIMLEGQSKCMKSSVCMSNCELLMTGCKGETFIVNLNL